MTTTIQNSNHNIITDSTPEDVLSLYEKYKSEILLNGTLLWRIHNSNEDAIIVNDLNALDGSFKVVSPFMILISNILFDVSEHRLCIDV